MVGARSAKTGKAARKETMKRVRASNAKAHEKRLDNFTKAADQAARNASTSADAATKAADARRVKKTRKVASIDWPRLRSVEPETAQAYMETLTTARAAEKAQLERS